MSATSGGVLDTILAETRREVARRQAALPLATLDAQAVAAAPPRSLRAALLAGPHLALIAEVKKASPSRGVLLPNFDHLAIAAIYQAHGAAALSVLTDQPFFQGSLRFLAEIRHDQHEQRRGTAPLLRKDFIVAPYQVFEARAAGADALLLIVAALSDAELGALLALTEELGMEALVEAHDEAELARALHAGAAIVGVNNRDLRSFTVDLATTERLARLLPAAGRPALVAESGIFRAADVERLASCGADAVLVGEALVTAPQIGERVQELSSVPR